MDFFVTSTLTTAIASFLFGLLILVKNKKSPVNFIWALMCQGVFVWEIGLFFELTSNNETDALMWNKVLYVGAIMIPAFYLHFVVLLLKIEEKYRLKIFLIYIVAFIFLMLNIFTKYFVEGVPPAFRFKYWVKPGFFYYPYFAYFAILFSVSFYLLLRGLRNSKSITRQQVKYVLISGLFGVGGGVTVFFPQFFGIYPFGNYFVILYIAVVAYAIVQHRLMGIRLLASKVYVVLIIAASSYLAFHFLIILNERFLGGHFSSIALVLNISLVIIIGAITIPFLNYLQKSSDYIFFRGNNPSSIIKDLSLKLSAQIDIKELINILDTEFKKIIGAENLTVVYTPEGFQQNKKKIDLVASRKNKTGRLQISSESEIYKRILKNPDLIIHDEIESTKKSKKLLAEMERYDAAVVAPLEAHKKVIGVIVFSEKITQEAYTKEDIEFIEIVGSQVAIAIENARLYKEIKDFNVRLKGEVKAATKDLKKANRELQVVNKELVVAYEKLHKLDRAKSEFLSIASHQLRTPLTSIKGFTSLLIEGTYGKISTKVKKVLEKVFLSNERLIRLVEDLLNISRIESGRFVFDLKENDIVELSKEIIDSFEIPAAAKNIKVKLAPLPKKVPLIVFDRSKIREVISNFIDNSLKYTEGGLVKVEIFDSKDKIRVSVSDKGLGIPKGELHYIFEKFQRGKDISQVHTEGVGLGLYVCKKIVEAHKGAIWADSEGLGKGSTFSFEFKKNLKPQKPREKKTNLIKKRIEIKKKK